MSKTDKTNKTNKTSKEMTVTVTPQLLSSYGDSKARIDDIMMKATADLKKSRMSVAIELAKIDKASSYTAGGYKSIKECATALLAPYGVKEATAWQLARVGKRFYLEQSETAKRLSDMFTPAMLAELTSMSDAQLEYELEHGGITKTSNQKELRAVAKAVKGSGGEGKPEVVTTYDIKGYILNYMTGETVSISAEGVTKDLFIEENVGADAVPTGIKLDGDKASATRHFVAWSKSENLVAVVHYTPHVAANKTGPVKTKVLDAETKAAINALPPAQRAAVLRAMGVE